MDLFYRTRFHIRQLHSRLFIHMFSDSLVLPAAASAQQCYCKQGNHLKTFLHIVILIFISDLCLCNLFPTLGQDRL